jgi:BON domain
MKLFVLMLILAFPAGGQTRNAAGKTAAAAHTRTTAPARPRVSDAEIESAIRAKFAKSKIAADKFTVRVQGGVATIEGKSEVVQHKGTATRLAKSGGAVAVVNKIQLSQSAKDKVNKNLEKGRRRAQIKRGDARSSN